ncbi:MAG TPA: hypothetical protein VL995_20580 [Cellvibrio sp.]|nr:hypothetical protein [Cellvibrio sp.]
MKRLYITYSLIVSFALLIAGCGGGGGGGSKSTSSSIPLLSSAGQVSSAPVISVASTSTPSSSSAPTIQLTIQGKVAADALAGGEVVFTIGAQTVKTNINNSLEYSVVLDVPAVDADKPFVAVATGVASDDWVQLAALYPSVNALIEKAGSDNLLNSDEFFGVNITPLTTAEYAEITYNRFPHATDEEYKTARLSLHPTKAMEQAAMVVRLLTNINVTLPAQTKTTLTYLLDANLAGTHLEALRVTYDGELRDYVNEIAADPSQVNVSRKKLSGMFVLEANYSQYLLTFNDDGTGKLVTGHLTYYMWVSQGSSKVSEGFTWVRKGKTIEITFDNPIVYETEYLRISESSYSVCDYHWPDFKTCLLSFESIRLDLLSESNNYYMASLNIPTYSIEKEDGSVSYQSDLKPQLARIISVAEFIPQDLSGLFGVEWVANDDSFVFSENGQVTQKDLLTQTEVQKSWTLEGNHLKLDGYDIWISHKEPTGFSVFTNDDGYVQHQKLIKRAPVDMTESDWVGRWSAHHEFDIEPYNTNADKTWSYFFQPPEGNWMLLDGHTQVAMSNDARTTRDMLAVIDGKYYMNECWGYEAVPFVTASCRIVVKEKSVSFDSTGWPYWAFFGFNEMTTNQPLFFSSGDLLQNESSNNYWSHKKYHRVADDKLFSPQDGKILEMTSASQAGIEVCEYLLEENCNEDNKRKYIQGLQVNISLNAGGSFQLELSGYLRSWQGPEKILSVPRGIKQTFYIYPDNGYSIDSVTGCGGVLNDNQFIVPPLTEGCDIVVNFKQ